MFTYSLSLISSLCKFRKVLGGTRRICEPVRHRSAVNKQSPLCYLKTCHLYLSQIGVFECLSSSKAY